MWTDENLPPNGHCRICGLIPSQEIAIRNVVPAFNLRTAADTACKRASPWCLRNELAKYLVPIHHEFAAGSGAVNGTKQRGDRANGNSPQNLPIDCESKHIPCRRNPLNKGGTQMLRSLSAAGLVVQRVPALVLHRRPKLSHDPKSLRLSALVAASRLAGIFSGSACLNLCRLNKTPGSRQKFSFLTSQWSVPPATGTSTGERWDEMLGCQGLAADCDGCERWASRSRT